MRWFVVLVVVALSGCSEAPAEAEQEDEADFEEFDLDDTKAELGVIRGVVVDPAVQPVAGAEVSIGGATANVTTNENGAFAFKDLEPGAYFVRVSKTGYRETQANAQVEAGVKEPPVTRIMLERMPGTEPAVVPDLFSGHITCSIRVPAAGFNDGCVVFGNLGLGSTQRKDIGFAAGNIWWIQTELTWEQSFQTSERLCTDQGAVLHENVVCGPSPIVQVMEGQEVASRGLDRENAFSYVVYPDHLLMDVSGNLVLEQGFELITHAFYNFVPPEGWAFGKDGEPVVPP